MASRTQWTWVWVNSGSWWWTGRPGVLQFMGSQSRMRLGDWTDWLSAQNLAQLSRYAAIFSYEFVCILLLEEVCQVHVRKRRGPGPSLSQEEARKALLSSRGAPLPFLPRCRTRHIPKGAVWVLEWRRQTCDGWSMSEGYFDCCKPHSSESDYYRSTAQEVNFFSNHRSEWG